MLRIIFSGTIVGLISGLLLFFVFFYIDLMTNIDLLHLLLNVDFIYPGELPFWVEVLFHLLISVVIGIIFKLIYKRYFHFHLKAHLIFAIIFISLYFLLIELSVETIRMNHPMGLTLWTIFHIGYLQLLHYIYVHQADFMFLEKLMRKG